MKKTLIVIAIFCSLTALGQTADDYLQSGIKKHMQKDFKGAINDYDKAIKIDKKFINAYFSRGISEEAIGDFKSAITDFNKTIELDSKFAKAYYCRAAIRINQQKFTEALQDLDIAIDIDNTLPKVLLQRGYIRFMNSDTKGACEDFYLAKKIGDKDADQFISQYCDIKQPSQPSGESLKLEWPQDNEKWKMGSHSENENIEMVELIHENETIDNWTELGCMMSIKGSKNVSIDTAMNNMYKSTKIYASETKLTFIEKDENTEYPWIIFTLENMSYNEKTGNDSHNGVILAESLKNKKRVESQLYYIIQGKSDLYVNFWAVNKATIPANLKEKWVKFFKTGKVVNK